MLSRQHIYLNKLLDVKLAFSIWLVIHQYIHEEEGMNRPPFSSEAYLKGGALKDGEDKYNRNQFNQAASDAIGADRSVPDTRHSQ